MRNLRWIALLGVALLACQQSQETTDKSAETQPGEATTVAGASEAGTAAETPSPGAETMGSAESLGAGKPAAGGPQGMEPEGGTEILAGAPQPPDKPTPSTRAEERTPAPEPPPAPAPAPAAAPPAAAGADQAEAAAPADTPKAGGAEEAQAVGAGSLQAPPDVYAGWKTWHVYCYRCHGVDAIGGSLAPDLRNSVKGSVTHDVFVQTATEGRPEKGMPSWKALLDPPQIEELYKYVVARSNGTLAAGRPTRAGS